MITIETATDRAIVERDLADWRAEQRRLMIRLDAQLDMKTALGRCNEPLCADLARGLEECGFMIRWHAEKLRGTEELLAELAIAPVNGVVAGR